jgi:hypothetical protein
MAETTGQESSRYLDHLGLLLVVTVIAIVLLALVELPTSIDNAWGVLAEHLFGSPEPSTSFMYFSLTTLSTTGLGDPAPVSPSASLLTGAEAIIGQVHLVTFVAMIVALYVNNSALDP